MNRLAKNIVGGSFAALGAAAAATLAVRTAQFTPPAEEPRTIEPISFDFDAAVKCLQSLIRCRTVSYYDHALEDDAEFEKLRGVEYVTLGCVKIGEHHSHPSLQECLDFFEKVGARESYITHMSHQLPRHEEFAAMLPPHVHPAYDGLVIG